MTKPRSAPTHAGFLTNLHNGCFMADTNSTHATPLGELKTCTKCAEAKPRTEFHIGKEYPDGRKATCKVCMQIQRRAKYSSQREIELEKRRSRKANQEWQALLPERKAQAAERLEQRKKAQPDAKKTCTKCASEYPASIAYFHKSLRGKLGLSASCSDCIRKKYAATARLKRDRYRESARRSYAKRAAQLMAQAKHRRNTDPAYNLRTRVSVSVRQSLGTGKLGKSWVNVLGFDVPQLRSHLEQQFTEGMTWERFLAGEIHIDHVIPVSFFNPGSTDSLEFRMCWNLKNLQPLWAADNLTKSDTLPVNFPELWNELYYEATRYAA